MSGSRNRGNGYRLSNIWSKLVNRNPSPSTATELTCDHVASGSGPYAITDHPHHFFPQTGCKT